MGIARLIAARLPPPSWTAPAAELWETEHRLLHALGRVRPPAAVQWMVTRSCDLKCEHCYAEGGRRAPRELSTDEARRLVIDATADMGCELLVLAGGELWLRRDIEELIEHAVARGLEWAMHTHGGHVARHRALLRRHPPALAAISLDGEAELHDELRGRTGSHAAALAAVAELVEAGCREVVLGTTVTRHNADRIADMYAEVAASGAHSWGLHLVAPEGRAELELVPRPAQLRRLAAFARRRRAVFPVELCNEWGSAGADDPFYRDRPFACGAGRISMVVDPSGEVMPCTTTDARESEGNVRDAPLHAIWRDGFARFRDGRRELTSDASHCWLQTRNGVEIPEAAFGSRAPARLVDLVPARLITLSHRALAPREPGRAVASTTTRRLVRAAAVGLAFVSACARQPGDSGDLDDPDARASKRARHHSDAKSEPAATELAGEVAIDRGWPARLDADGLATYASWADMSGPWKRTILPALLAWEQGGPAPEIVLPRVGEDGRAIAVLEDALGRYVGRGFANGNLGDLLELLDAAERAALYDAAFAASLWRAAERVPARPASEGRVLDQRITLYARLARHQDVAQVLVATSGTLGPPVQRAWLKKSAPPPGWRDVELPPGFEQTAKDALAAGVSGPWDDVGISVRLTSEGGGAVRYRDGHREDAGNQARWTRLDVMVFPSATRVGLPSAIEITAPAGAVLTHASLEQLIDDETGATLDKLIDRALAGDEAAIDELEVLLPVAHDRLRARLASAADGPGAPALRTLLVAYEE
jgi:MoaA/NifB/PqqE/SkfB family radical SAM enzyme